ncbi:tetratricopeptide repeat protein [Brevundimonas sp. NPDC092305]|uniref:tetratricopeptide repeat protein n=1 Tax=Brevundimonas sp. NPDC092305 TaxID=3363957 RepID=UPI0038275F98
MGDFGRLAAVALIAAMTASCAVAQTAPRQEPPPVTAPPPPPPPPPPPRPAPDVRISAPTPVDPVAAIEARATDPGDAVVELIALAGQRLDTGELAPAQAAVDAAMKQAERPEAPRLAMARVLAARGRVRHEAGDYEAAMEDAQAAQALFEAAPAPDQAEIATLIYDRARALDSLHREQEAEAAARDSLERRTAIHGVVHEKVADSANLLANTLTAQGRHAEADPLYRQVLGQYEVLYGPNDPRVAIVLSNLGNSLRRSGRAHQAAPLYARSVAIAEASSDPILQAQTLTNQGWYLHQQGDGVGAEGPFRKAYALALQIVGPDHPFTGVTLANLAYSLSDQGRWAEAEDPFRDGLKTLEAGVGADSPDLLESLYGYAAVLDHLGRPEEAEALYDRAAEIASRRLPPAHADGLTGTAQYAGFLIEQGRSQEALDAVRARLAALLTQDARGRDWRMRVRGAQPLFGREVEAAWAVAAAKD